MVLVETQSQAISGRSWTSTACLGDWDLRGERLPVLWSWSHRTEEALPRGLLKLRENVPAFPFPPRSGPPGPPESEKACDTERCHESAQRRRPHAAGHSRFLATLFGTTRVLYGPCRKDSSWRPSYILRWRDPLTRERRKGAGAPLALGRLSPLGDAAPPGSCCLVSEPPPGAAAAW